jgi:hypothetical protein
MAALLAHRGRCTLLATALRRGAPSRRPTTPTRPPPAMSCVLEVVGRNGEGRGNAGCY